LFGLVVKATLTFDWFYSLFWIEMLGWEVGEPNGEPLILIVGIYIENALFPQLKRIPKMV